MSKAERARQKTIDEWKAFSPQTCRAKTAKVFQRMTKAEAAALPDGDATAIIDGSFVQVVRYVGECVCITCGKVGDWNVKGFHCGHWIGRVHPSTLLESDNVAVQCASCNEHNHGRLREYTMWMEAVRGVEVMERLQALKHQSVTFSREDLVDMRIEYRDRLKVAELKMKGM